MGWKSGFTFGTRAAIRDLTLRAKVVLADISHHFFSSQVTCCEFYYALPNYPSFLRSVLASQQRSPHFCPHISTRHFLRLWPYFLFLVLVDSAFSASFLSL